MWWNAIAGASMGLVNGQFGKTQAKNNNLIADVNAAAGNKVRAAENSAAAAKGNLQRWVQSVNNNRTLDNGGRAMETTLVNARRTQDAQLRGKFSQTIRFAEQEGAAAAAQAAAGISGSVVDMVDTSTALRNAITSEMMDRDIAAGAGDVGRRIGSIFSQMVGGLDSSIMLDTLDYGKDVPQHAVVFSTWSNVLRGAAAGMGQDVDQIGGAVKDAGQAVESWYDRWKNSGGDNDSTGPGGPRNGNDYLTEADFGPSAASIQNYASPNTSYSLTGETYGNTNTRSANFDFKAASQEAKKSSLYSI